VDQQIAACGAEGVSFRRHGGMTRAPKPINAAQQRLFDQVRRTACADRAGPAVEALRAASARATTCSPPGLPNLDTLGVRGGDIHSENEHAWPESFASGLSCPR
jgi:glutamate carboxypeptidase